MHRREENDPPRKIAILVVFLVFLFAVSSLIMSVGLLSFSQEERAPTINPDEAPSTYNPLWGSNYEDIMKYMWYATLGALVIISLSATAYAAYRRDFALLKQVGMMIVGGVILIGLFYGVMYYAKNNPVGINLTGGSTANDTGIQNPNATTGMPEGKQQSLVIYGISAVLLGSAVALILLTFYYLSTIRKRSRFGEVEKEEVSEIIRRTMEELWAGNDPRNSIIRCYGDMCSLLEKRGSLVDSPALTPREFLEEAEERIPVSQKRLEELTFLFEEARYSPHELSPEMVERAKAALGGIQEELGIPAVADGNAADTDVEGDGSDA